MPNKPERMIVTNDLINMYKSIGVPFPFEIDEDGTIPYNKFLSTITFEKKEPKQRDEIIEKKIEELKAKGIKFVV